MFDSIMGYYDIEGHSYVEYFVYFKKVFGTVNQNVVFQDQGNIMLQVSAGGR